MPSPKFKSLKRRAGFVVRTPEFALFLVISCLLVCLVVPAFLPGMLALPFVALALSRDRTRQNVRGGGLVKLREIHPTPSDTFLDAGYLGGTDISDEHQTQEMTDERGDLIDIISGQNMAKMVTSLMQSSIDEFNLLKNARGKYYDLYYHVTQEDGSIQEVSAGICKIKPGFTSEFKANTKRVIPVEIFFLSPKAAFTRTPAQFNIVARVPYVLTENATAYGEPSDTAANLAAAVL